MIALLRQCLAGLRVLLLMTVVLGIAYPLTVMGVGQLFGGRADGSLITRDGEVVGSALIGQAFEGDTWFLPRPSAAGDGYGYDPLSTSASNLGPENAELFATIEERRAEVAAREDIAPSDVPPDALTASGSGLDPHISPEYARLQVDRVARARSLDPEQVSALVEDHSQGRILGFLGEERVNVLELNLDLDELAES